MMTPAEVDAVLESLEGEDDPSRSEVFAAADLIRAQRDEIAQLTGSGTELVHSSYVTETTKQTLALKQRIAELENALRWYQSEAEAIAKNMRHPPKPEACMASVTVLSLDGGGRARAALARLEATKTIAKMGGEMTTREQAIEIAREHGFTCIEPPPLLKLLNMEMALIAAIEDGIEFGRTEEGLTGAVAAINTLIDMGYNYHGGKYWKPPLGKQPADDPSSTHYDAVEANAICHPECAIAEIVRLRKRLEPAGDDAALKPTTWQPNEGRGMDHDEDSAEMERRYHAAQESSVLYTESSEYIQGFRAAEREFADRIAALNAAVDTLKHDIKALAQRYNKTCAAAEADRRDAERYRWALANLAIAQEWFRDADRGDLTDTQLGDEIDRRIAIAAKEE